MKDILLQSSKKPIFICILSSVLTATGIFTMQYIHRKRKITQIKEEIKVDWEGEKLRDQDHEILVQEQLSRNIAFLGVEGVHKLRESFVVVVGLGGVGSHAAHMLVRAGVEQIRFIDFDQVTLSSLNRHAVATRGDVGIPKVIAMKNHLLKTVPHCRIDAVNKMFKMDDAETLIGNPTFVLDCIDHLQTKIELIEYCLKRNIKIISSMGYILLT